MESEFPEWVPSELKKRIEDRIQIDDFFQNAEKYTVDELYNSIVEFGSFEDPKFVDLINRVLLQHLFCASRNVVVYAKFAKYVYDQITGEHREYYIKTLYTCMFGSLRRFGRSHTAIFISCLVNYGVLDLSVINSQIASHAILQSQPSRWLYYLIAYCQERYTKEDPQGYHEICEGIHKRVTHFSNSTVKALDEEMKNIEKEGIIENNLVKAIHNDDLEAFTRETANIPNFDGNSKLGITVDEWNANLLDQPISYSAAFYGANHILRYLIINGAESSQKLAQWALEGGNVEAMRLVMQMGEDFSNLINVAARTTLLTPFKWIEETYELNLFVAYEEGRTPLHAAASANALEILLYIMSFGDVDVTELNAFGYTPLHRAAENGCLETVELFLTKPGSDVNVLDARNQTCLHHAAAIGDANMCRLLISKGASVNITGESIFDGAKAEPLFFAAVAGNTDAVKVIVEAGADVNAKAIGGTTALHAAAESGSEECVRFLIENGADIEAVDEDGHTPLHRALQADLGDRMCRILVESGANIEHTNAKKMTPLFHAINNSNTDAAIYLIDKGASMKPDYKNRTPLHIACENGLTEVIEKLLTVEGINCNAVDKLYRTPLRICVRGEFLEGVRLLCKVPGIILEKDSDKGKKAAGMIYNDEIRELVVTALGQ